MSAGASEISAEGERGRDAFGSRGIEMAELISELCDRAEIPELRSWEEWIGTADAGWRTRVGKPVSEVGMESGGGG